MSDLRRYLARVVLEDAFRDLAERDVEASFEGFELSDEHKEALRARDARVLSLLAEAIGYGTESGSPAPGDSEEEPAEIGSPPTEAPAGSGKVSFVVQILPQQVLGPGGVSQLAFGASIHAPQEAPELKPPAFALELTLQPQEVSTPNGPGLAWGTGVSRWPQPEPASVPSSEPAGAGPAHSWAHRVDASETQAAAAAVLAAAPADRLGKLLALAEALRG